MRRNTFTQHTPPQVGTILGTGLIALDIVIPESADAPPRLQAGGTCGNVLASLAYLGWNSYPIARLGQDGAMQRICQDLAAWNVHLEFVMRDAAGGTPVIAQYIRGSAAGATHSFSWQCPTCGADLPRYRPPLVAEVEDLLPQFPKTDVFFFDRTSAAIVRLAEHFRASGALVVFEPSSVGDINRFRDATAAAHVIKYSSQRLGHRETPLQAEDAHLIVETLGGKGLRYRGSLPALKSSGWHSLPALTVGDVRDTAGCGDWCTAGLIHSLGAGGADTLLNADVEQLSQALRFGQTLAAWNCWFEGARGGMYEMKKELFDTVIAALIAGRPVKRRIEGTSSDDNPTRSPFLCSACPPQGRTLSPKGRAGRSASK